MEGQCHFLEGNLNAVKRVKKVKEMLNMVGVDSERLAFFNLSAAQGPRWAEICTEFTKTINELGPSPIWHALKKKK
ncbi:MAG: hydrogenase iron-sulfur subunit [Desulfobulbaceae bacterium]|nr:hydrogenase iron-sulfur subunit [Desulfobulbaceae bacterium]